MTRQEAFQTLQVYVKTPTLIRHHLAVEAVMRSLARVYSTQTRNMINEEQWAITGLLHDADYELTRNAPEKHTLYLEERIGKSIPKEVMYAIKAHNYKFNKVTPISAMDWALYTCDELTGFVISCAVSQKKKVLSTVTSEMVLKKLKDESFAKSVDRAQIYACEQTLKIPLNSYVQYVLKAMQGIATDLGFDS